jgi:hypothetical protein
VRFGNIDAHRIADMEDVQLPPARGFRDLAPDTLREHAQRLGSHMVDPDTLNLLISFRTYVVRTGGRTILMSTEIERRDLRG